MLFQHAYLLQNILLKSESLEALGSDGNWSETFISLFMDTNVPLCVGVQYATHEMKLLDMADWSVI